MEALYCLLFLAFWFVFGGITLVFYLWPIVGSVLSWRGLKLFYQAENKSNYWGLGLLVAIYGLGIGLLFISETRLWGEWILLGNSLGIVVRSSLYEWRIAQGRVRRLSINLLLAIVLPLTAKAIVGYSIVQANDCLAQAAVRDMVNKGEWRTIETGRYLSNRYSQPASNFYNQPSPCGQFKQQPEPYGISITHYDSPNWLYQRTFEGYQIGYVYPTLHFFEFSFADRICWYDSASQRSGCNFVFKRIFQANHHRR